ncbi:MAG TPA: ISL3 family transposase [Thauera sp.]|nr:ISL3 family transposase [Thauera sp.]
MTAVDLDRAAGQVVVKVSPSADVVLACPQCGRPSPGYDHRVRRWRHLDTCQYVTILEAQVPRLPCPEHGVVTCAVPWAEPDSGFTQLFEALVIDWLREASIRAVARQLGLSWGAIDRIMQRAVTRGLARRDVVSPTRLCVDETSFRKRHDYVTVVTDPQTGTVLYVADDRKTGSLVAFYDGLSDAQKAGITAVSMDMWPAYINATRTHVPAAQDKIGFDRFHVAKLLGEAVDQVRRQEHKQLRVDGCDALKGTRYDWLTDPSNMTHKQKARFRALRDGSLKTARAWAIKDLAARLWDYRSRTWAAKAWKRWLGWALRCQLPPMRKAALTIKAHLWGILNAIVLKQSNGHAEGMNSTIQRIKQRGCGFRNKERFRNAIYFHLGGLDLYPDGIQRACTRSRAKTERSSHARHCSPG